MSTKIIQITDLHLNESKEVITNGINTYNSAKKVLDTIKIKEKDADCLVLSGDLSNDCSQESYNNLMSLLQGFNLPIYLMSGNHDSPLLLKELSNKYDVHFKNFDSFYNWGLFMFNTKKDNSSSGILDNDELLYFDEILENNSYETIIVCLLYTSPRQRDS